MRRQRGAQFLRQVQRKRAGFNANLLYLILSYYTYSAEYAPLVGYCLDPTGH